MSQGRVIFTNDKMEPVLTVDQRTGTYEVGTTLAEAVCVLLDINDRHTQQLDAVRGIVELLEMELGVQPEGGLPLRLNRCIVRMALKEQAK